HGGCRLRHRAHHPGPRQGPGGHAALFRGVLCRDGGGAPDHGGRPGPLHSPGPEKSRYDPRGYGFHRGERGLRRPDAGQRAGAGMGSRQGERLGWRHCPRPSHRLQRRPPADHPRQYPAHPQRRDRRGGHLRRRRRHHGDGDSSRELRGNQRGALAPRIPWKRQDANNGRSRIRAISLVSAPSDVARMPEYFVNFADIARRVPSAATVVVHSDFAEPQTLVRQFAEQAALFSGARVYSLMPMAEPAYLRGEAARHIQAVSFFPGGGLRRAVNSGAARIHRCNLSEIGALFDSHTLGADLLLLQVSKPNDRGEVSLGVSVDYMPAVLAQKPLVVAQVNAHMPFTSGATAIPLDAIDYVIEQDEPLVAFGESRGDDLDQIIARHVAGLVDDGDVIQAGIGALPDRVLANLGHLKHLGGHTGIITTAWRPLIESGVVDNSRKPTFKGVTLTTMAGGDR